jgi:hypothetical protein
MAVGQAMSVVKGYVALESRESGHRGKRAEYLPVYTGRDGPVITHPSCLLSGMCGTGMYRRDLHYMTRPTVVFTLP